MRWHYELLLGLFCGSMDHTSKVSGQTSSFCHPLACSVGPNECFEAVGGYLGQDPFKLKYPSSLTNPVDCKHMKGNVQA